MEALWFSLRLVLACLMFLFGLLLVAIALSMLSVLPRLWRVLKWPKQRKGF
jgi:hypothetical protein